MTLRKVFPVLLLSALTLEAQVPTDPLNPVTREILGKNWEQAARQLDRAEKKGLCKKAVCLALRAKIAEGTGDATQALTYARQAADLFGPDSGLKAGNYNDVGAVLYRRGKRDVGTLKLAERAFRQADAIYQAVIKAGASNIRYNLATVLKAQGRSKEAKQIMDALETEGLLIDPGMAILGEFQGPVVEKAGWP